jgi:nitrogen fixation protein NifB
MTEKTSTLSKGFPAHVQEKIDLHPCFGSKNLERHARIHLPVAPRCNIQCRFCNRKYDCACESRPGVTSSLLTPQEALARLAMAVEKIPHIRVCGIAGPGDPLANPRETFATLELVHGGFPHMKLCLGTNGLLLPDYASALAGAGLEYITVTVNAVDAAVAEKIYAWVQYDGALHTGIPAAEILLEQQQKGIAMLSRLGVLVKINTVLIPGINEDHIPQIARRVMELGATMLNIVPMIRVDGSAFEDRQPPAHNALLKARGECETILPLMSHCRQCRADAVGLLCSDRSAEFAPVIEGREGAA